MAPKKWLSRGGPSEERRKVSRQLKREIASLREWMVMKSQDFPAPGSTAAASSSSASTPAASSSSATDAELAWYNAEKAKGEENEAAVQENVKTELQPVKEEVGAADVPKKVKTEPLPVKQEVAEAAAVKVESTLSDPYLEFNPEI